VPAWAVNQTVRRNREVLRELLGAGREVRSAQRRAATGLAAPAFATATAERRRLVKRLTELAGEVLDAAGRTAEQHLGAVSNTFEAAAADEEAAATVEAGRLSKELTPPATFEVLSGFEVVHGTGGEAAEDTAGPSREAHRAERDVEKWRTRLATAREELRAAEADRKAAEGHIRELERDLDRARGDAQDAESRRSRVAARIDEAERKLEEAAARLEEARGS
jgi:chromosome segregation ATPase